MCWRRPRHGASGWKKSEIWAEPGISAAISSLPGSRQIRAIFVWCRRFGDIIVISNSSLLSPRWAFVVLAAATLALAGCGRKGPLDLPPTGSSQSPNSQSSTSQPAAAATGDTETEEAAKPSVFNSGYGSDAAPVAGRGPKRPFILDPLLNSN